MKDKHRHIWYCNDWEKYIKSDDVMLKKGLRLHINSDVDSAVRLFISDFAKWLRKEFEFPLRVNVYVKASYRIKAKDGDMVVGTCWRPDDYSSYPYIRLATGDYNELVEERGEEGAMWAILASFSHELTHYYQHINNLQLTLVGEERQAQAYANRILDAYDLSKNKAEEGSENNQDTAL